MGFKLGDKVRWTSQAAGTRRTKEGEIIEVVPPRAGPKSGIREPGGPRDHESYVVRAQRVLSNGVAGQFRKYWPMVKYLRLVDEDKKRAKTQVVNIPPPTSTTQIAPEDAGKPTTSDTVNVKLGDDVTLTDHGVHNEIPLEELKKAEEERRQTEEEPVVRDDKRRELIEAIARRRVQEAEDDDQEDCDDGTNGERW